MVWSVMLLSKTISRLSFVLCNPVRLMNAPLRNVPDGLLSKDIDLHGTIEEELTSNESGFSPYNVRLLRYHGVFQQDDRDQRYTNDGPRQYRFMVRIRATGGKFSAWQLRGLLELTDELCDGKLHITSRQGVQLSGIEKTALRPVIRYISDLRLTTLATGGDYGCNIMCCPAPQGQASVNEHLQATADTLDACLAPRLHAYDEIWQRDCPSVYLQSLESRSTDAKTGSVDEPIPLPHKFKIGLAAPHDNCTEVYAQDLGLLAVIEGGRVVGYNALIGGNMRSIVSVATRSSVLAKPLAFVDNDSVAPLVCTVVDVFREFGNRRDRNRARLKYLLQDWGLDRFQQVVEERLGSLEPPRPVEVTGHDDHLGWQRQDEGKWFVGIHVKNGRISDEDSSQLKSALKRIADRFVCSFRLTPQRNILVCDIEAADCLTIDAILAHHNVPTVGSLSNVRRYSEGCPGLPNCSAAITESERLLPSIVDELETEISQLGLSKERFTVRITGCPFGCTRCYLADIAIVGRTVDLETKRDKYAIFLGGDSLGRRLGTLYKDLIPADQIMATLRPLLLSFRQSRLEGEALGDFFVRTST